MKLRFLKRIVTTVLEEAPERTAIELEHLARPRTPEAQLLVRFLPALEKLPVDEELRDLLPAARMMIENLALECECRDAQGEARRKQVKEWSEELRRAVL